MAKALVLDLDGTLIPFDPAYLEACEQAVDSRPWWPPISNTTLWDAKRSAGIYGLHTHHDGSKNAWKELERARKRLKPDFIRAAANNDRTRSLRAALESARNQGIPIYVFTHSEKRWTDAALNALGISDLIPEKNRITRDNKFPSKNTSAAFTALAKHIGVELSDIVLFDDSTTNCTAATRAGLTVEQVNHSTGILPEQINNVLYPADELIYGHIIPA